MYPVLRMSEAYYIAAECLKDSDPKRAIELLNTVRYNRGLNHESNNLPANKDMIRFSSYKSLNKNICNFSK